MATLTERIRKVVRQMLVEYIGPSSVGNHELNQVQVDARRAVFEENDGLSLGKDSITGLPRPVKRKPKKRRKEDEDPIPPVFITNISYTQSGLLVIYSNGREDVIPYSGEPVTNTVVINHYFCCD
jgi:hypothetical protein